VIASGTSTPPSARAVVDPPELGLEPLARAHDRAAGAGGLEAPHPAIEAARPRSLPLGQAAGAEPLGDRVVDALGELDRSRSRSTASGRRASSARW
jgi:hypothetical protein